MNAFENKNNRLLLGRECSWVTDFVHISVQIFILYLLQYLSGQILTLTLTLNPNPDPQL